MTSVVLPFRFRNQIADCPNLQMLVEFAGRRHAASIGEEYVEDPFKRPPHQGGYQHLTPEDWAEWDRAVAEWQQDRRDQLEGERGISRRRRGAPQASDRRAWWK